MAMTAWISKFDERLTVTPPLGDEQLSQIPARRGVVALLADGDEPIVLMTAGDIRARVRTRLQQPVEGASRKSADLRRITRGVAWTLAAGHFETDLRFLVLARAMWPSRYAGMLAWKPAWFVHVDVDEKYPHFSATRKVFAAPGRCFGPFAGERAAQRFLEAIQDGFDLCRDYRCLCRSPDAERCTYGQMGKCLSPCDGSIGMSDYKMVVAEAAEFAAGRRDEFRGEIEQRMRAAAEGLEFELAAREKARLDRLSDVEAAQFEHVRPAEEFRFILVQRAAKVAQAKVFLVDRGKIAEPAPIDYPPKRDQLEGLLAEMRVMAGGAFKCGDEERWQIALVAGYLFSSERRRGLIVRWHENLGADELAAAIEDARELLSLRPPRKRPKTG